MKPGPGGKSPGGKGAAGVCAVAVVAVTVLSGCAGEENRPRPLRPLVVKEQISSVVKTKNGYQVRWAGLLANRNPWHFGEHVVATMVAKNAAGKEIARHEQPLDAVPPAGKLAFAGQATAKAKPTKVTVTYSQAHWKQASRITSAFQRFPAYEVVIRPQKNGGYLVTGRVGTPYREKAQTLVVTALLRDHAGKLMGGASTFVDDVTVRRNPRFILTYDHTPRRVAKADVMVQTWGSTARPYEELAMGGMVPLHTVKPKTQPFPKDRGRQLIPGVDVRQE